MKGESNMDQQKLPHDHHSGMEQRFDHMPAPEAFGATAELFKLLGDPTRVRLFWLLCHCEECVLNLSVMMNMSSPALSHHCHRACGGNRLPGLILNIQKAGGRLKTVPFAMNCCGGPAGSVV